MLLQGLVLLGLYGLTLFCAFNIGRLQTSTKVLKFLRDELTTNVQSGETHVLELIHKLITIL